MIPEIKALINFTLTRGDKILKTLNISFVISQTI